MRISITSVFLACLITSGLAAPIGSVDAAQGELEARRVKSSASKTSKVTTAPKVKAPKVKTPTVQKPPKVKAPKANKPPKVNKPPKTTPTKSVKAPKAKETGAHLGTKSTSVKGTKPTQSAAPACAFRPKKKIRTLEDIERRALRGKTLTITSAQTGRERVFNNVAKNNVQGFNGLTFRITAGGGSPTPIFFAKTAERGQQDLTAEIANTKAVGQLEDSGTDQDCDLWMITKVAAGTEIGLNHKFQELQKNVRGCKAAMPPLADLAVQKLKFYVDKAGILHNDLASPNIFWNADLTSVDFIDWGSVEKVSAAQFAGKEADLRRRVLATLNEECEGF